QAALDENGEKPRRVRFERIEIVDDPDVIDAAQVVDIAPVEGAPSYARKLVTDEGVRRRIVGVFDASTSPPKE
ncbi:MAG TPA: hypothetical protein VMT72_23750, partial [Pseudolabrys sp.]|nr:hypothetical protein [Pseudolabrys sp.]